MSESLGYKNCFYTTIYRIIVSTQEKRSHLFSKEEMATYLLVRFTVAYSTCWWKRGNIIIHQKI